MEWLNVITYIVLVSVWHMSDIRNELVLHLIIKVYQNHEPYIHGKLDKEYYISKEETYTCTNL
jgi:hypothetical protein